MKKLLALLLAVTMVLSLSACGKNQENSDTNNPTQSITDGNDVSTDTNNPSGTDTDTSTSTDTAANTIEELKGKIKKDVADTVSSFYS